MIEGTSGMNGTLRILCNGTPIPLFEGVMPKALKVRHPISLNYTFE
jgi:hypothetical protein